MDLILSSFKNPAILTIIALVSYAGSTLVGLALLLLVRSSKAPRVAEHPTYFEVLAVGIPFSILGVTVGYLTGISREAAVGTVVPAVLTLLGAVTLYVGADGGKKGTLASATMVYLTLALVTGVGYGSRLRVAYDDDINSPATLILKANDEANLKSYRKSIGLDEDPKSLEVLQRTADIEAQIDKYRKTLGLQPLAPPTETKP